MPIWLRTDEKEDVIASLRMVDASARQVASDPATWKWVVIGTHSAIQSAMAFHLGFGNDLLVAKREDAVAWLQAHEDGAPYPSMMMDNFLNLYAKLKRHEVLGFKFAPHGTQGGSIKKLNHFRNEFIHFMPKGWSIELSGMPRICLDCLDIIEELDTNSLCMRWDDDSQRERFGVALASCQEHMKRLELEYGT